MSEQRKEQSDEGLLHPLHVTTGQPSLLNNPFCYEPHPLAITAMNEVARTLECSRLPLCFRNEIAKGKMFGVLVVSREDCADKRQHADEGATTEKADGKEERARREEGARDQQDALYYLAAYSGQVCGRTDWEGFVPMVYDYLQPDGYFLTEEHRIEQRAESLRQRQAAAEDQLKTINLRLEEIKGKGQRRIDSFKATMAASKKRRDDDRRLGLGSEQERIKESQWQKAELRRMRQQLQDETASLERQREALSRPLRDEREAISQASNDLQRWLFDHFTIANWKGERKPLTGIYGSLPPSGSGECCEPKLLHYAFTHHLHPVSIAMMWWGESPCEEVRHHGHYYPACNRKCKPLLSWMLDGYPMERNVLYDDVRHELRTVYDDDAICVVDKPAGMLSVPGKSSRESVMSVLRTRFPKAEGPLIVHRLDMATSGLMVIAKTLPAYHALQRQFARHEISKTYVALLEPAPPGHPTPHEGRISLPLMPDLDDRPRQIVSDRYGREAVTRYEMLSDDRILLHPLTGRTHQLRVHCAHARGLSRPIVGDPLYGTPGPRLCLHACRLTLTHPVTGNRMTWESDPPF